MEGALLEGRAAGVNCSAEEEVEELLAQGMDVSSRGSISGGWTLGGSFHSYVVWLRGWDG